ncbi:rho-N domain-containing protein 1, chloroplastic-like [Olea europaea var. sylvestris]|uniref:Rho-N domain-containing 1, chloroplastic n=1 Tax=Olea europaea subsp. europaea TaxID=158383 RepID=A0A8S0UKT7_OLEEU|nr:rho-N domain-containing protein 1, chloroplastic-like [Olea europaea var. sylvestris]CAA3019010.1 rho-N domain-containing 1, chloroplastic [Olea europaea subsp. europaea]
MSCSIRFISNTIPGHGRQEGCLPCSGVSGGAVSISSCTTRGDHHKVICDVKFFSLTCASRSRPAACNASSGRYRRNPDFPKQNKSGFSRSWNRYNEERDGYENLEESEIISSKNGQLLSVSGNPKFQATSTPGPREKEIVELFRKVQARLRERTAVKEEKKIEDSQGKSKESETVDSLLKLLRKHSVQQGKKKSNSASSRDFVLDQPEQVGPFSEDRSTSTLDSNNSVKQEMQESQRLHVSRPASNFRKRSPVPQVKFQPVYSDDGPINSVSHVNGKSREMETNAEPDVEPIFSEGDVFDQISEDETSEIFESDNDEESEEETPVIANLSGMKLSELRALAKSRGLKGFSKMKKQELIELLCGSSI